MSRDSNLRNWLADHPRMMGALFVLLALLAQAGTVGASTVVTTAGP